MRTRRGELEVACRGHAVGVNALLPQPGQSGWRIDETARPGRPCFCRARGTRASLRRMWHCLRRPNCTDTALPNPAPHKEPSFVLLASTPFLPRFFPIGLLFCASTGPPPFGSHIWPAPLVRRSGSLKGGGERKGRRPLEITQRQDPAKGSEPRKRHEIIEEPRPQKPKSYKAPNESKPMSPINDRYYVQSPLPVPISCPSLTPPLAMHIERREDFGINAYYKKRPPTVKIVGKQGGRHRIKETCLFWWYQTRHDLSLAS